jgi:chemotaxis protein MotB
MAGSGDKNLRPIVVKRIKKAGHAHHGGAWKIAYADFVTAMMAFFLLMWLLGSTTEGDLQGIAAFFKTPLKISMAGGSGSGDSSSVLKGGGSTITRTQGQVKMGESENQKKSYNLQAFKAEMKKRDLEELKKLKGKVETIFVSTAKFEEFRSQVRMDINTDGLRIQIVDAQNRPMFDSGQATVKDYMRDILREIGKLLNDVPNRITISGHTDASPYSSGERGYSNWELSADRANSSRRELIAGGMSESKVVRIIGLASSVPLDENKPLDAVNRRISIIVMNKESEERALKGAEAEASDETSFERAIRTLESSAASQSQSAAQQGNLEQPKATRP